MASRTVVFRALLSDREAFLSWCLGTAVAVIWYLLTLILLTWRKWWTPNNASKWQMGFNSAFKGLIILHSYRPLHTLVAGCWLEVSIRKFLRPATSAQVFLGFPVSISECWDGSQDSKAATACFSCSPPDLNFLDPQFIFMYTHYNHCHRATAHLQLNILLLLLLLLSTVFNFWMTSLKWFEDRLFSVNNQD